MSATERFFDTNILLYLLSADADEADRAERELSAGGVISVQVLNEFVHVARRKLNMTLQEIRTVLATVRALCAVVSLDLEVHALAMDLAERYGIGIFDANILSAALHAGCVEVVSDDLQDGMFVDGRMRIRNPFRRGV